MAIRVFVALIDGGFSWGVQSEGQPPSLVLSFYYTAVDATDRPAYPAPDVDEGWSLTGDVIPVVHSDTISTIQAKITAKIGSLIPEPVSVVFLDNKGFL